MKLKTQLLLGGGALAAIVGVYLVTRKNSATAVSVQSFAPPKTPAPAPVSAAATSRFAVAPGLIRTTAASVNAPPKKGPPSGDFNYPLAGGPTPFTTIPDAIMGPVAYPPSFANFHPPTDVNFGLIWSKKATNGFTVILPTGDPMWVGAYKALNTDSGQVIDTPQAYLSIS